MRRTVVVEEGPELERPVFRALVLCAFVAGVVRAQLAFVAGLDHRFFGHAVFARTRRAGRSEEGREEVSLK